MFDIAFPLLEKEHKVVTICDHFSFLIEKRPNPDRIVISCDNNNSTSIIVRFTPIDWYPKKTIIPETGYVIDDSWSPLAWKHLCQLIILEEI